MLTSATCRRSVTIGSLACLGLLLTRPSVGDTGFGASRRDVAGTALATSSAFTSGLSLTFERNQGQAGSKVDFVGHAPGMSVLLEGGDALFRFGCRDGARCGAEPGTVRMSVLGAVGGATASGVEPLAKRTSYAVGRDRRRWVTDVPNFAQVKYAQIYPGIDLVYHGAPGRLEFDFKVAPGADPGQIQLQLSGGRMAIEGGDAVVRLPEGRLVLRKPTVYQEDRGGRRVLDGRYARIGRDRVAFRLARYDRGLPLVVDPVVTYSSYMGGSGSGAVHAVVADASGALYLAGSTRSVDPGAGVAANTDAWICKIAPGGAVVDYCAVIGGSGDDSAQALAVDGDGQVYVTGATLSADFPVQGALQPAFSDGGDAPGNGDAFVLRLGRTGTLDFATYLGGSGADEGRAVAVDGTGVYVGGVTNSSDFPVASALQPVLAGGHDGFVAKLSPSGTALIYSTFFGGSGQDVVNGLAVDAASNVFVVGQTDSADLAGAARSAYSGAPPCGSTFCGDGFVAKLDSAGASLDYSTYVGGADNDSAVAVAVAGEQAFVTGFTCSADFPTTPGAFQASLGGGCDAYLSVLAEDGSLSRSSYLGGTGRDAASAVVATPSGDAYLVGVTSSADFPVSADALQSAAGGGQDAFVAKVSGSGSSLSYSSYLGGNGDDVALAVSLVPTNTIAVSGHTTSTDFQVQRPLQAVKGGDGDGFFVALDGTAAVGGAKKNGSSTTNTVPPETTPLVASSAVVPSSAPSGGGASGPLAVFAADCTTPKTDFIAGDTACAVLSYPTPPGPRRINWVTPSGRAARVADVVSNPQSDSFTLPVTVADLGTWRVDELDLGNDIVRASATLTVRDRTQAFADVGVYAALDPLASLQAGDTLSSSLFVWNRGPDNASNVVITDTTPTNATFVSVTQQSGTPLSCSVTGGVLTCTAPTLVPDASAVLTVNYQLLSTGNVLNPASVSSSTADTNNADDSSTASATLPDTGSGGGGGGGCAISCPADISRNKDAGEDGAFVTYASPVTVGTCDVPTCEPASGSLFPLGATQVTCTASAQSCSFLVTVNVPEAITITLLGDNPMTVQCHGGFSDPGATAQNGLGQPIPVTVSFGSEPLDVNTPGIYTLIYTASDGTQSAVATRTVIVVDTTAPVLTVGGVPIPVWPPSGKFAAFTAAGLVLTASDSCSAGLGPADVVITSVSSDEPAGSGGDDILIGADCRSVQLRADRAATGNGRVYTISLELVDGSGNVATASKTVVVPHDQRRGGIAIDDGPSYTVTAKCQ